jgi:hypothetical protein
LRHSQKTSGVRIGRVASSFSLLILAALAFSGEFADLDAKLQHVASPQEKVKIIKESGINDAELSTYLSQVNSADPDTVSAPADYVSLKAMAEAGAASKDQTGAVKKIKSSLVYNDDGTKVRANWLAGAIKRIKNLFNRNSRPNRNLGPDMGGLSGVGGFAGFFIYFVWFLLGAAIIAFIIYALRFISFGKLRKRGAKAMLEDSEPERTLDEWLTLAESFEKQGRYREAVRALYLACLLKFDERNIARFMRGQTNWEHLSRIENSPRLPSSIDFRTPTQAFDRIWYGHKVRGQDDVADFKTWYSRISSSLKEMAA